MCFSSPVIFKARHRHSYGSVNGIKPTGHKTADGFMPGNAIFPHEIFPDCIPWNFQARQRHEAKPFLFSN